MLIIIGSSNNTQTPTYTLPNQGYPTAMSEYRSAATETEVQPETNRNRKKHIDGQIQIATDSDRRIERQIQKETKGDREIERHKQIDRSINQFRLLDGMHTINNHS